jgi:DNA-directed RNA polymerase specialized sigma24 family protein
MQTMVLDERFEGGSRADHQAHDPGQPAAAVATAELVARANLGEQAAWDQLVDRYGAMVWAVARARGLGPADAGDVSQVTWLLLTQHLGTLQQPERVGDWLLRTATREADRMRRLRGGGVSDAGAHDGELLPDRACAGGETPAPTAGGHRRVSYAAAP